MANLLKGILKIVAKIPVVSGIVNRSAINSLAYATKPRPHAYSLWSPSDEKTSARLGLTPTSAAIEENTANPPSRPKVVDYTSWPGLVDRVFTGRHLPPAKAAGLRYPEAADVVKLFQRPAGAMVPNPTSSALFCYFAQWFTDSFLRTDPIDPRRNTSNHEINLCQIYGLDESSTWALREGQGGRLSSRMVSGQEYPPLLYANGVIDPQYFDTAKERGLSFLRAGRAPFWENGIRSNLAAAIDDPARRDSLYASGLDRAGSTIIYSAFSVIFLREHNRIAKLLSDKYAWDDSRIFETARMINIRQLLTVVVEDYITHISDSLPFKIELGFAEGEKWYRSNRISIEFDLLYRWHSLIPDIFTLAGNALDPDHYRFNNALLETHGVEQVISDASRQPAGRMGLFNTPWFMERAELHGLELARTFRLQSFNAYRERFGLSRYQRIDDFADSPAVAAALKSVYGDNMEAVEFGVGLFAEKRGANDLMPKTLLTMVAYDAFTHIFTNPLLAKEVHNSDTFSQAGLEIIEQRSTLADIIKRNCDPAKPVSVSLHC